MTTAMASGAEHQPVDGSLWTEDADGIRLIGSRCLHCATVVFPRQDSCPRCTRMDMADHPLATRGTLWTWTVQGFRPKSPYRGPAVFQPYGVGYVDLDGEVLVESRLLAASAESLRIGAVMDLVLLPVRESDDLPPRATFAFTPSEERP